MVDVKDNSILSTGLSEKIESVAEVTDNNFIDDDPMDNLAYSDSESASNAMADDEFCDALDQFVDDSPLKADKKFDSNVTSTIDVDEVPSEPISKVERISSDCGKTVNEERKNESVSEAAKLGSNEEVDNPDLTAASNQVENGINEEPLDENIDAISPTKEDPGNSADPNSNPSETPTDREDIKDQTEVIENGVEENTDCLDLCNDVDEPKIDTSSELLNNRNDPATTSEQKDPIAVNNDVQTESVKEINTSAANDKTGEASLADADSPLLDTENTRSLESDTKCETTEIMEGVSESTAEGHDKQTNSTDIQDEELLFESSNAHSKTDPDSPEYSESYLLKDTLENITDVDEDVVATVDKVDGDVKTTDDNPKEEKHTDSVVASGEKDSKIMNSIKADGFNAIVEIVDTEVTKATEILDQDISEPPSKLHNDAQKSNDMVENNSTNETEKRSELNRINGVVTPSFELLVEHNGESMESQENKDTLLEEMNISPASVEPVEHSLEESSSSFRDDFAINDNDSVEAVVNLKDENSTDARDGFSELNNVAEETFSQNEGKHQSADVSQSNDSPSVILTDESIEENCNKVEQNVIDTSEKLNEELVEGNPPLVNSDDDDVIFEESVSMDQNDKQNELEADDEQPPAKKMRIEPTETDTAEPIKSDLNETTDANQDPSATELNEGETRTELGPVVGDYDDIVIVESTEAGLCINANSNKRAASPTSIDSENEIRKKPKPNDPVEMPTEENDTAAMPIIPAIEEIKSNVDGVDGVDEKPAEAKEVPAEAKIQTDLETEPLPQPHIEPKTELNIELLPKPEKVAKRTITLEFATKFKKNLTQMSRKNLEEFVLEKLVEAVVHKSEYSEIKQKCEAQEQMIMSSRSKLQEISKQYRDLEMVYARLKRDLEAKNQNLVTPIKITRAVGLQVCLQKNNKDTPPAAPAKVTAPKATAPKAASVKTVVAAPTKTTPSMNTSAQQTKVAPNHQQILQISKQIARQVIVKPVPDQPHIVQTVQRRIVQPSNVQNIVQVSPQRKIVSGQKLANLTIIPSTEQRTAHVVKKITQNGRLVLVNPTITTSNHATTINKLTPAVITKTTSPRGGPSGSIQVRSNLMANNSNTIDLTDEDDPRPQRQLTNNPPALVSINVRSRQLLQAQGQAQTQQQTVQRQLVTTQQIIRPAAATQTKKVAVIAGKSGVNGVVQQQAPVNRVVAAAAPPQNPALQAQRNTKVTARHRHPAPLPYPYNPPGDPNWKHIPPRPIIRINNNSSGIVISWNMEQNKDHAEVVSYQIYAYQETSNPPSTDTWRHVGDVKAMLLPMAVTLTQFQEGQKYHFAVRAVDEHGRSGLFSVPRTY